MKAYSGKTILVTGSSTHQKAIAATLGLLVCAEYATVGRVVEDNPHSEFIQQKRQGKRRVY
jgi:hypothetical protein